METVEEVIPLTMRDVDYSLVKEQNNKVFHTKIAI